MTDTINYYELPEFCELCGVEEENLLCCIKCGTSICKNCSDELISDWESVCKECGW